MDVELGGLAEMTFLLEGNDHSDQKNYAGHIGAKQYFPVHHYNWYPHWLTNPGRDLLPSRAGELGGRQEGVRAKAVTGPGRYTG